MPTRYWLVDPDVVLTVSRLEGDGGVRAAEAAVDDDELAATHAAYAAERDAALPGRSRGPAHGGVGGTRERREVPARALRLATSPAGTTPSAAGSHGAPRPTPGERS